jgi:hypothetical protein
MQPGVDIVPNEADASLFYQGQTVTIAAANGTAVLTFNVPTGYSRLKVIQFDPDKFTIFSLRSQKLGGDVMENLSTKIGSASGKMFPRLEQIPNDQLKITLQSIEAPAYPTKINFTLGFGE